MSVRFDAENKPGISNLITIYSAFTGKTIAQVENEFIGSNYGTFKTKVADVVCEELSKIQKEYQKFLNGDEIDKILDDGKKRLLEITHKKYDNMRQKMGVCR